MINTNKKDITKELLLKEIDDYSIFKFYIGDFEIRKPILSPLRKEKNPSFALFIGKNNEICFNDFNLGGGDVIKFVQMRFGLSFYDALSQIVMDFNLAGQFNINSIKKTTTIKIPIKYDKEEFIKENKLKYHLGKRSRKWKLVDWKYWGLYGVTYPTLQKFRCKPIDYIFCNEMIIKADKYAYSFSEFKDKKETFKLYQPYSDSYKWLNNHNHSVWQGWSQLPETGDILIITKSLKDVMSIYENTGIPAISLQAENVKPKSQIIKELKKRFRTIYVLYDNDFDKPTNWGREWAIELARTYGLIQIEISEDYKSKDFSDLYVNHGKKIAINILEFLTSLPF